jgi:NAD(P)-dependent dehydrogenase (short-subunit alcohol dehydrogenase family)
VETFDRIFAANVRAPYFLVAALAPKMAAHGSGSIVNVSSMAGQVDLAGGAVYGATKAALASMTRSWAAEFSPAGVRVNAIAAGPFHGEHINFDNVLLPRQLSPAARASLWRCERGRGDLSRTAQWTRWTRVRPRRTEAPRRCTIATPLGALFFGTRIQCSGG